jgi:hypothetical protein
MDGAQGAALWLKTKKAAGQVCRVRISGVRRNLIGGFA